MKNKLIYLISFCCLIFIKAEVFADCKTANVLESHYPQPYEIGELGTKWQFPSDHLPRGATIGNFHICFWNILNKNYLNHIEENTQGLRDSSILADDRPVESNDTLTIREMICGQIIMEMISHPTHPRSLIGLQETHEDVHEYLRKHLPSNWEFATPPDQPYSQDVFIYDTNVFELIGLEAVKYSSKFPKTIFTITMREKSSDKVFRFLQSHIPGGPINSAEGCAKFAEEALKQYDPSVTLVLMGDMNQSPDIIIKALEEEAEKVGISQPFMYLPIAYPSHINTKLEASWIDHFFIYATDNEIAIEGSQFPEDISDALVPIVQLFKTQSSD